MLRNETRRLWILLDSIRNKGYQRHNGKSGDIEGIALENGTGRFRWSISPGNHRVGVLSALGQETAPVRIHGILRRQDASIWPNVVSGLFSPAEAIAVFDQLFEGSHRARAEARRSTAA